MDEMWSALLLESDQPVLARGSVCHTDGAKAYRWLSSPLNDGTLVDAAGLKLSHTCVKHKPPHPEFSKKMRVQVWVGDHYEEQARVGGTQKIDGFFASFRRVVGRRPLNTVGPSSEEKAPRMEQLMHFHVRLFQLKHWFGGQDMFAVFGKLRQSQRDVGAVTWASMSAFKPFRKPGACTAQSGSCSGRSASPHLGLSAKNSCC